MKPRSVLAGAAAAATLLAGGLAACDLFHNDVVVVTDADRYTREPLTGLATVNLMIVNRTGAVIGTTACGHSLPCIPALLTVEKSWGGNGRCRCKRPKHVVVDSGVARP